MRFENQREAPSSAEAKLPPFGGNFGGAKPRSNVMPYSKHLSRDLGSCTPKLACSEQGRFASA